MFNEKIDASIEMLCFEFMTMFFLKNDLLFCFVLYHRSNTCFLQNI